MSERNYELVFRTSPLVGANAFALPNGTIVMTDELVNLVDNTDHLSGILLHEIAHVQYRHSMQQLARQSSLSALILLVTGDASFASSLILLLPTVLIEAEYSREFETEADVFALDVIQHNNLSLDNFIVAMEKLMHDHTHTETDQAHDNEEDKTVWDYFSTHPPTDERLNRFRQAQQRLGE